MKQESFEYLSRYEEVFDIAYRSNYVRNIPIKKLKRLISIYNEIIGAKSGYNAYSMCRNGSSCLVAFMLELRVEYLRQKDLAKEPASNEVKVAKNAKNKQKEEQKTISDEGKKDWQADEV